MDTPKYRWKKIYSLVFLANAGYILFFYLFMQYFG
jgi:hypothetical protein